MEKSFGRLLIKVNHAKVAIFYVVNKIFKHIPEYKIISKNSEFTVTTVNMLYLYY